MYKRVSNRGGTPVSVLERAAAAVQEGTSLRFAAVSFKCDRMTLKRFIESRKGSSQQQVFGYAAISKRHSVFSSEMEKALADHVKTLADQFHGLSLEKCRAQAYEFAVINKLTIPQNWSRDRKAGMDWWKGFKVRNKLSIRAPEATSMARATAFNKPMVDQFYDNLSSVLDTYMFDAKDIYNTDEVGCTTVQIPSKVVAQKGKKQVGSITSAERGDLVTVVYTICASGNVLPPLFIFPRVNYRDHFIRGSPPGSTGRATRSGWINEEVFVHYLKHIVHHSRCSIENKILLILDNHESHISLEAIDFARTSGIVLLTLPLHTSHRLQPLDRSVYGPFKNTYNQAMDAWLRSNPGKSISIYEIPGLVNEAQLGSITPRNVLSGFKNTGICPFNRNLFTDVDFAPSLVTDHPLEEPIEPDVNVTQDMQQQVTNPGADNDAEVPMSQGDEGTPTRVEIIAIISRY